MSTNGAGEFLDRVDARAQSPGAPLIDELAGPGRGVVLPELLELFFEQIGAHALQVVGSKSRSRSFCLSVRFSGRLSRHQRVFFRAGSKPSCAMRRASAARTSSRARFILATMWKRFRMLGAFGQCLAMRSK